MKNKNLFEMGSNFSNEWSSNNREKPNKKVSIEIKEPNKHQLHFSKEKRRGKTVTIVKPFHLSSDKLKALLKTVKKRLGTGGTIKEESLEFQGEVKENLREVLDGLGYLFR
jgi:translation initiation factor 1